MSAAVPPVLAAVSLGDAVGRLERLMPKAALNAILARWATRLEELAQTGQGAELELHVRVHRGRFWEARWDADERIE